MKKSRIFVFSLFLLTSPCFCGVSGSAYLDIQISESLPVGVHSLLIWNESRPFIAYDFSSPATTILAYYKRENAWDMQHKSNFMDRPSYLYRFTEMNWFFFNYPDCLFVLKYRILGSLIFRMECYGRFSSTLIMPMIDPHTYDGSKLKMAFGLELWRFLYTFHRQANQGISSKLQFRCPF